MAKNVLETIKILIKTEDIRISKLAKVVDHSEQSLRSMLRGTTSMPVDIAEKILTTLGYTIFICKTESVIEISPQKSEDDKINIETKVAIQVPTRIDINRILAGTLTKKK